MPQAAFQIGAVVTQLSLGAIGPRILKECQA
jgi:chemotaxis response regulator CheB